MLMMGSDDGLDFLRHPPPPHAKLAQGKVDQGQAREGETMAVAAAAEAAAIQSAASFSPTSNPNQNFSVVSEETNINSECNVEWPSDWFVEEPRAIHSARSSG
nr:uncharacterized protein LOC127325807 [Lolium perenne]